VVAAVAAIAVLVPLTAVLAAAAVWTRSDTSTVGRQDFAQPLVIPPLDDGTKGADGVRRFDLRLQQGTHRLRPVRSHADLGESTGATSGRPSGRGAASRWR
jgi:hypothetical protein